MLTVFRGNRAEWLAELLAAQLKLNPPDPFEQVQVMVNTWPTSRWLGEQLAVGLGGIAANIRFPFPGSQLRQLVDGVLAAAAPEIAAEGAGAVDPWRANRLVWPVLEILPELLADPRGRPLQLWWQQHEGPSLGLARWQLGRAIADAIDDYTLYRPAMVAAWGQGKWVDGRGEALAENQQWQPLLLERLRERLGELPFGLKVHKAIQLLGKATPPAGLLPKQLRLFGLSSLAPIQVELLQALGGHIPVDLYLLTPCPDLWQRCGQRRERLSSAVALRDPFDSTWLLEAPGLEARFGRLGGEFQQLLEGTGESQLGQWQEKDLFCDPAAGHGGVGPAPLLAQLQKHLANPAESPSLERAPGDSSLEFHPCPGRLRQVQIVRDRILQLLANDSSLQPRDILVMTPQVDLFAPLVASVFGDSEATGVHLPWRLTDRSQQSEAGISRTLLLLLQLASERFTASALEKLLESSALRSHFLLSSEEIASLQLLLQRSGFRWGLDGQERGGDATGSLSWAIDRLLLGLVLPQTPGLAPAETAPLASGHSLELVGRWLHLLTRLRHWLVELRRIRPSQAWAGTLQALLADLFGDGGELAWELPLVLAAIDDWQQAAGDFCLPLDAAVVAAVLDERLAADSGRFGHRSGALTISALEPMRAIPHRVIVLIGLDAGVFPRQRPRSGFHLLEKQRLLGDPQPADQDRYVLMEALLSARSHLLITWSSRDERRGEALPPATPVRQWLEWLQDHLPCGGAELLVNHAVNPLDRSNFLAHGERPPSSCDRRLLEARRWLEGAGLQKPEPLAQGSHGATGPSSPSSYGDLREWLVAPQAQWLAQLGLKPREWGDSPSDLDSLQLDERQRAQLLRLHLEASPGQPMAAATDLDQAYLLAYHRGEGLLPPRSGGCLEASTLANRWHGLVESLEELGEAQQQSVSWQGWESPLAWRGSSLVLVHTAKLRARHGLELWLQLQLAVLAGLPVDQGVVIARGDRGFGVMLRLQAPELAGAEIELERLDKLRGQWRQSCWPVPPQSGWTYVQAEASKPGSGAAKAIGCWEGGIGQRGERQEAEQALCFGVSTSGAALLEGPMPGLALELLTPLMAQQAKPHQ
ncbi:exodeoxyribonuclease V subunit gamma [Cyanobium sp. WAJ14-Wanaka]|uniref:exodeoxyribonuclease V subunit gamma n=1 Tax=Cyanobium sp. WAJ14-Wanaka TaxID=2823725 RepID=UPI0020CE6A1B|nr:exodeoxyribonuclease V subunit gamma [Cyanobium sp. WAJ14-Wanaka]MCP9774268.1 exodeoxyribonuclease V subunit gamma [Cyanobium sp. WAJ14-Wanaka]